ncbi:MAG: acyl-CoA carboxylase subunit beta [Acidimicrobiales bacterium]
MTTVAVRPVSHDDGESLAATATRALDLRIPLVLTIATHGADPLESVAALHGWGATGGALAQCSGTVPVLVVVDGPVTSSLALMLGLADLVIMTEAAMAYVSGPTAVADLTGLLRSADELGGPDAHAAASGLAACVVRDRTDAFAWADAVLRYLPPNVDSEPSVVPTSDPATRHVPELRDLVPTDAKVGYDVRDILTRVVDHGELLELRDRWAPNIVTGFASVAGLPVGIVANQPQVMAGTIDIVASQKAARFVALCDAFNVPILTFVDTPGFLPGVDLEWRGMIRHGAQLAYAYAEATVPRVAVVTRKAYGGAYIVMDCKAMGNDLCFAWPSAEIAVMGARGAVQILHRGVDEPTRRALERDYDRTYANPYIAAARGYVDDVIDPADTRSKVSAALQLLRTKQDRPRPRRHGNCPL